MKSAQNAHPLTADSVRDHVLATILSAVKASIHEPLLDVETFLLPSWSVMRLDVSDLYMVMTSEDPSEPGLRADKDSHFYNTYVKDLDLQAKQGKKLQGFDSLSQISIKSPTDLLSVIDRLDLKYKDLDGERLEKIWKLMHGKSHQYA